MNEELEQKANQDSSPMLVVSIGFLAIAISWGREKGAPLFSFYNYWRSE